MLDIQDITVQYGEHIVLDQFSLHMDPGEIISLVGESGSGKTTVIRAIMDLLPGDGEVTAGDILFEGASMLEKSEKEIEEICGTQISMIFQDSGAMMNPIRSIGSQFVEYLRFHNKSLNKKEARILASSMLEKMRLPDSDHIMKSYPFQLSGGMRQRVGIAMAMSMNPKLLLADEPTSALDVTTQAQIVRELLEMHRQYGMGMILVTHNLGVAAYISNRILVMKDGRIVDSGTREQILASDHPYTRKLLEAIPSMEQRYKV